MRGVIFRPLALIALAVLLALGPPGRGGAQTGSAQVAALLAATEGRHADALALARAILAASPGDAFAQYVIGTVMLWQGDLAEAERAGKAAFRAADSRVQKHESARLAATAAAAADRQIAARYWLRHAAATAPDPNRRAAALAALDRLRAATPWTARLGFGIQPSNNVNSGASSRFNEIDGIPIVGVLSEDAVALPGTVATLDARLGYRVNASPQSRTEVSLRFDLRAVELRGTPMVSSWTPADGWVETEIKNSTFGSASIELGLAHRRTATPDRGSIGLDLAAGRVWTGGTFAYDLLRLGADLTPRGGGFFYGASLEKRVASTSARDQTIASLRGGWRGQRANGDRITLSLGLRHVETLRANARGTTASLQLSYAPARPLGPLAWSASAGLGYSDYPDFNMGIFAVPGGRQETMGFAQIDLWAPKAGFAGFSPQITLRAVETLSNVSSFERRELSVGFGVRSEF